VADKNKADNMSDSDRPDDRARPNPYTESAAELDASFDRDRSVREQRQRAGTGPQVADPMEELESLRGKLSEAQDKLLRTQAELENYRKRARREMEDERRFAEVHLVRDLLPIVDNISRAIEAAENKADAQKLLEGLKMMLQQFEQVFAQHHCKLITAEVVGEPFDPNRHEAVMQQPSEEHEEHTVLGVTRPGLELHDRIVRPAQVIVSKKGAGG
jgi:molecular chaperone GrpE